jgi:hypothetical protein
MPRPNESLVTTIKPKAEENVNMAAMLLFKKHSFVKRFYIFPRFITVISFQEPKLTPVSVPSHASAMLLLMVAGDYEILTWDENL